MRRKMLCNHLDFFVILKPENKSQLQTGGKETTDNQGQLQASAAIPRGGRTVEG